MRLKSYLLLLLTTSFCYVMSNAQEKNVVKQDSVQRVLKNQASPRLVSSDRDAARLKSKLDSKNEIFYSDAPMYIGENDVVGETTSLYILGTAKFADKAEISQKGETSLTGDFVLLKEKTVDTKELFIFNSATDDINSDLGVIRFVGQWNRQNIIREDLDGARFPDSKKLSSVVRFPTIKVEKDQISKTGDKFVFPVITAADLLNGGPVPTYNAEKEGFLSVASNMALSARVVNIENGNRFSVEAITEGLDKARIANPGKTIDELSVTQLTASADDFYKVNPAYVDVRNIEDGGAQIGYSELDMRLYTFDKTKDNVETEKDDLLAKTNQHTVTTLGQPTISGNGNNKATFFRGFSSPFGDLRADHMFYHVLTQPIGSNVTGPEGPIADPQTQLMPGSGYFYGMDVSRAYFVKIGDTWQSGMVNAGKERARGGYNISRLLREVKYQDKPGFNLYSPTTNSSEGFERFNTGDVSVAVVGSVASANAGGGINALGNPYMTPITLNGILGKFDPATGTISVPGAGMPVGEIFDVYGTDGTVKAVHSLNDATDGKSLPAGVAVIRPSIWVPSSGLIANMQANGAAAYGYNLKYHYLDVGERGGTLLLDDDFFLEPMQMFMIQVAQGGTFKFTNKMKTFRGKSFTAAIGEGTKTRSFTSLEEDKNPVLSTPIPDWFVIEAVSDDGGKITADRTAVRFFATANASNPSAVHDVSKNILTPLDKKNMPASVRASLNKGIASDMEGFNTPSNVIYTVDSENNPLLSNGIGYRTKEIPLYYVAGAEKSSVTLRAFGVENVEGVPGVWLVDDLLKVTTPLNREGVEYTFESYPDTENSTSANRFRLKFYDGDDENPTLTENPITCYYSGSTLHIGGLNEKDMGSTVNIFDLQGRLMANTTVNQFPNMEYRKPLGQGTFIVKISGQRSFTTKFVNIQNY